MDENDSFRLIDEVTAGAALLIIAGLALLCLGLEKAFG